MKKILKITSAWICLILFFVAMYFIANSENKIDSLWKLQTEKEKVLRETRELRLKKDNYLKILSWIDFEINKLKEKSKKIDQEIEERSLTGINYTNQSF